MNREIIILNDEGGAVISVESKDLSPTLRAQDHGHQPIVCFDPKSLSDSRQATSIMSDSAKDSPCACYTKTSFGQYAEGVGTIKSSGGDLGGGSETLVIRKR